MPRVRPPAPILGFYLADVAVGLVGAVTFFAGTTERAPTLRDFFRLASESNLPTWYAASKLLLIGLCLLPLAFRDVRLRRTRAWPVFLLPGFFFLLSLDEAAMLHERVGHLLLTRYGFGADLPTGPWVFAMAPFYGLLAGLVVFVARPYGRGRPLVVGLVLAGGVLLVGAAAGLEFATNLLDEEAVFVRRVFTWTEEVSEMLAASTLLWAAIAVVRAEGIGLSFGAAPPAGPSDDRAAPGVVPSA